MDRGVRGQSELIGVILLTGIIVILSVAVGTVSVSNLSSQAAADPLVDIGANATTQQVTVQHMGGEKLAVSDVTVILRGTNSERYPLETFTQRSGDDATRFEPGDEWQRTHGITGDRMTVLLVDEKANAIVDTTTVPITVTIAARFSTSPRYPKEDETVTFDASESTVAGSTITSYAWEFGDGTTASGETATHSYTQNGSYAVNLTVTAADGRVANLTKTVRIYNEAPNASFTYTPVNPNPGDQVDFDATGSSDPDGTIDSYDWDFGDGTTGSGEAPTHSYDSEGDYTVHLDVTDNDGATRRTSQVVSFGGTPGFGDISVTSILPYANAQYQTVMFAPEGTLPAGETVTIDLQVDGTQVSYGSASQEVIEGSGQIDNVENNGKTITYLAEGDGDSDPVRIRLKSVTAEEPAKQSNPYTVNFTRSDGSSKNTDFKVAFDNGESGFVSVSASNFTDSDSKQTLTFTLDSDIEQGERVTIDLSDAQKSSGSPPKVKYGSSSANAVTGSGSAQFVEQGGEEANIYYTAGPNDVSGDTIEIEVTGVSADMGPDSIATYTAGFSRGDADTQSNKFTVTKSGGPPGDGGGGGSGGESPACSNPNPPGWCSN
ncbi:PKD domain-containing protein [Salinibaculum sp. GCM10025337]|uniref:PKD domain-containing protein n=1 Tax=Salinibaculum sp. GCM10025337 TaxID=3252686 RepID=UPI00361B5E3A